MNDARFEGIRALIQEDAGKRGLRGDPEANLITATTPDFHDACRSIAATTKPALAIVTGFLIPHAQPPCGETDGPLGALFLARALVPLGIRVALVTDSFCKPALEAGLAACGLERVVPVLRLPPAGVAWEGFVRHDWQQEFQQWFGLTHLIALERVGPSHTPESVRAQPGNSAGAADQFRRDVPDDHFDRCHTMRGRDITAEMAPAHLLFEEAAQRRPPLTTIGIGDGGNEIGMGKVPWEIIRRNIPNGALTACRVAVDHLIVAGISNWGAYGLATGIRMLRNAPQDPALFDVERERELLKVMVEKGPLVDGVTGKPTVSVDGLSWEQYALPLKQLGTLGV